MKHPLLDHQLIPERVIVAAKQALADGPAELLRLVRAGEQYIGVCPGGLDHGIVTSDPGEAHDWLSKHEREGHARPEAG